MMKHDLEEQLEELERQGISRRHFLKILTAAGVITLWVHKSSCIL